MQHTNLRAYRGIVRSAIFLYFVAVLLLATQGNCQTAGTGNVQGTVADSSGAEVAGASVALVEVSTGVKHETRTDNAGRYVFRISRSRRIT